MLRFEVQQDVLSDQSWAEADELLYSSRDIELACGALVTNKNGTLQLIHLSTKEILLKRPLHMLPDDSRLEFFVDAQHESLRMATFCVSYLSTVLRGIDSVTIPHLATVPRLDLTEEEHDLADLRKASPFIEYASTSWQAHLIDGKSGLEEENSLFQLQELLTYDLTMLWLEFCVALRRVMVWTLERNCNETRPWATLELVSTKIGYHEGLRFLRAWSNAVVLILNEYGSLIDQYPYELHFLDLRDVLNANTTDVSSRLPKSYITADRHNLRETVSKFDTVNEDLPNLIIEQHRKLPRNAGDPNAFRLGFVLYDDQRRAYYTAERKTRNIDETTWAQEEATGRRLQPARCPSTYLSDHHYVVDAVMSVSREYLAVLYAAEYFERVSCVTSIWSIEDRLEFRDIKNLRPWI